MCNFKRTNYNIVTGIKYEREDLLEEVRERGYGYKAFCFTKDSRLTPVVGEVGEYHTEEDGWVVWHDERWVGDGFMFFMYEEDARKYARKYVRNSYYSMGEYEIHRVQIDEVVTVHREPNMWDMVCVLAKKFLLPTDFNSRIVMEG